MRVGKFVRRLFLFFLLGCLFILSSCKFTPKVEAWEDYDGDRCWNCGYYSKELYSYEGNECVCADCIVGYDYIKCNGCGNYYAYSAGDTTRLYCSGCVYEGAGGSCCLCGASYIDFCDMVKVRLTDDLERVSVLDMGDYEYYYICVDCLEDYYKTIEPLKPCFNCQHCKRLTYYNGLSYNICNECIERFDIKRCENCGEYWEYEGNLHNGSCSYCVDEG